MRKDGLTDGRNEANSSIPCGNEVESRKSDIKNGGGGECKEKKNRSREIGIGILKKKYIYIYICRKYTKIDGRQTKVSGRRRRSRKLVRRAKRLFSFFLSFFEGKKCNIEENK
jgi:hypothetical protein